MTYGNMMDPLLTGDLIAFGFNDVVGEDPDPFEFLFSTTGGDLAFLFPPQFGMKLSLLSPLSAAASGNPQGGTVFGADFGPDRSGVADIAPIPEPAASLLSLVGGIIVAHQLRRGVRRR